MGFRLLLLKVIARGGANMGESGLKVDPSFINALKQPFTNSLVAKRAREKRRQIIAERKAMRSTPPSQSNVVSSSPIKESMVSQIAREKRRQIIAAKKAMRCKISNGVLSSNVQSSQQTKTKWRKKSRLNGKKLQHEPSEALWQNPQADYPTMNGEKK